MIPNKPRFSSRQRLLAEFRSDVELAKLAGVSRQAANVWRSGGPISKNNALLIENATDGRYQASDLILDR